MTYLYETHFHTAEVSPCGNVPAAQDVRMYKAAGYSGVVVTDHFSVGYLQNSYPGANWKEKLDYYLRGYRAALACADDAFAVILGMEVRLPQNGNDYLIFGLSEDFLYRNEWFCDCDLRALSELCRQHDLTLVQAHPFRNDMTVVDPRRLDGMEVYNGNRRHDSRDAIARQWAARHQLLPTSGSDFHETEDLARGGVYLNEFVRDAVGLRRCLLRGDYTLKDPTVSA